ncbi:MAG: RagB/SusD family nutrient uptake outer membrane protein [Clostridium sp.]|nr:RagB/SusD family nutrient uptake outer membrane protein [Bacteroides sp.]MCM1198193.1 RagB/SusD family nutrient uptake outer membrane protein [Clostridium sp.]
MKRNNIFLIFLLGLVSCVGIEQFPTNSYSDATFWNYEENCMAALYLGYNQCWNADMYFGNNILSDDVYGSRHTTNSTEVATGLATTNGGRFSSEWNQCYQELRTIHTALDNKDRMNLPENVKSRIVAELRLMRAFTYMRLTTWFGDVPFLTSNPTLPESKVIARTSADVIKAFIHSELEEVSHILPRNTELSASENGRFTCGTAVALNARAYLLDNDFENCAKECEKLVNGTEYGTYALAASYEDLFVSGHYGPESIMNIEFAYEGGVDNIKRSWDTGTRIPQSIGSGAIVAFSPTQELVNCYRKVDGSVAADTDYEGRDLRFYATIAYNGCTIRIPEAKACKIIGSEGVGKGTYTCWTNPSDEEVAQRNDAALNDSYNGSQDRTMTGYYNIKNYAPETIGSGGGSYKPLMEMRYADVLLMYAESMYETGAMTESVWNATMAPIRRRAGFSNDYCSWPGAGDLRQTIRDERRCELALEGRRCFDLRRWAAMDTPAIKSTGAPFLMSRATGAPFLDNGSNIQCPASYNMKYWFPVPQGERDKNSNLTQNPGW